MIKSKEIEKLRSVLKDAPRDLLLFELAVKTDIKLKELLRLRTRQLIYIKSGDNVTLQTEDGTHRFIMDRVLYDALHEYRLEWNISPDDYLFRLKRSNKPLSMSGASAIIKNWFIMAGIEGNYGAVALRNTQEETEAHNPSITSIAPKEDVSDFFEPIRPHTAQEIVYDQLSKAIISGRIPPGAKLVTEKIAQAFNVSHAPVRVAFNWLEAKGLISTLKKKASIVRRLSFKELQEIFKIRGALETLAMQSSITKCTEETLSICETFLVDLENAKTWEELDICNTKFHQTLYRDAQLPLLESMIIDICERVRPYIVLACNGERRVNTDHENDFHWEIVSAMRKRDLKKALNYLERDLNKRNNRLEFILEGGTVDDSAPSTDDMSGLFKIQPVDAIAPIRAAS